MVVTILLKNGLLPIHFDCILLAIFRSRTFYLLQVMRLAKMYLLFILRSVDGQIGLVTSSFPQTNSTNCYSPAYFDVLHGCFGIRREEFSADWLIHRLNLTVPESP